MRKLFVVNNLCLEARKVTNEILSKKFILYSDFLKYDLEYDYMQLCYTNGLYFYVTVPYKDKPLISFDSRVHEYEVIELTLDMFIKLHLDKFEPYKIKKAYWHYGSSSASCLPYYIWEQLNGEIFWEENNQGAKQYSSVKAAKEDLQRVLNSDIMNISLSSEEIDYLKSNLRTIKTNNIAKSILNKLTMND